MKDEGCSHALGDETPKSPHTEICDPKIMLHAHKMFAIFVAKILFKSIHESSPKGVRSCDRVPPISQTKGSSQISKRCQFPDAFWDVACDIVVSKNSASKYTYTGWVRCQIQCSPHQVYIAFYVLI